jgi:predicted nucleotidyltransferase
MTNVGERLDASPPRAFRGVRERSLPEGERSPAIVQPESPVEPTIPDPPIAEPPRRLNRRERAAALAFIEAVRREVDAELVEAALFGSKARGDARSDSDVDILLVFRWLPDDREPQATQAETLAERIAEQSGVPVTTWSVSLVDLGRGVRTPMLVDALEDAVPLWWAERPLPRLPFTPEDGLWCSDRLLARVHEGGFEVADHLRRGDRGAAARRGRDDVVRLCTALLLLRGITRPRRGAAAALVLESRRWDPLLTRVLRWAAGSYGSAGRDEEAPVGEPPGGMETLLSAVSRLRDLVRRERLLLEVLVRRGTRRATPDGADRGDLPVVPRGARGGFLAD